MNILICDDDKLYIDMIRKYVDEFFADHKITDYKVYEYNSGDEAAKNNEKIDIAFLDVEMDGINGIEAGKCLRNNNKNIVLFIITSYMGYLDDAMDEGVFRYINKPLERPVIMRGLHKALLLCSKSQSKKINIEYKGDNVIIEQDSIICIESLVRKRYIKTDTQSYISLKSLSYWQSVLDEDKFFLVNKSFIVNIDRVERFTDKYIELKGIEEPIDLSREKRTAFKQKMLLYLAGQEWVYMEIIISYAFAHIIEAIILWMSMSQMYEHRYKQWVTGFVIMAGHAVMFVVFLTGNIYFVTVVNLLTYILLIYILYNVNKRAAVFWGVIYIAIMALSEQMIFYVLQFIMRIKYVELKNTMIIVMVLCLCKILYFILIQIMVMMKNKSSVSDNGDLSMLLLMVTLIASLTVFITYYIIGVESNVNTRETVWAVASSIILVSSDILVLWVSIRINERKAENERIKIQLEQEKADARYYKLENEKNESLEILRHDMNNHLNTMLGMETNSDLKDYITLIMEQYNIKKRTTFSNNNVLNGLISEYSSKCYTENIEFVVDIRPGTIDDIVATDIVALFGNILSNAYEAAKQCEENSEKYIELVVKRKHETTFIKCVNSCAVPPKIIGGNFISIKKDSDRKHGYGMKSIDKIVNKYHGSHIEQFDENEFTISIMLMI